VKTFATMQQAVHPNGGRRLQLFRESGQPQRYYNYHQEEAKENFLVPSATQQLPIYDVDAVLVLSTSVEPFWDHLCHCIF
jgi:hypothetical protein